MKKFERLWHAALIGGGYVMFLIAGYVDRIPERFLFVGPAMMLAGVIMRKRLSG